MAKDDKAEKRALAEALLKRKAQGRSMVDDAKRKAILGAYLSGKSEAWLDGAYVGQVAAIPASLARSAFGGDVHHYSSFAVAARALHDYVQAGGR
jgi:hypothetical protein